MKNLLGITMGDPKGIGPEVIAKAWKRLYPEERSNLIIYGAKEVLLAAAQAAGAQFDEWETVATSSASTAVQGMGDAEAGRLALAAIEAAAKDALAGKISGIVTGPVNKHRIKSIRPDFIGHTEFFASSAGSGDATMMFAEADREGQVAGDGVAKRYCISLATTHLPIREVAASITPRRVLAAIRNTHAAMGAYFACPDARIAVMALNPHAGEGGSLGHEEEEVIAPAIARAAAEGIDCVGPLPADGLFDDTGDFGYDAALAMYHDQGLIPMKLLCRKRCVNVTLGLPYVRTSPAHGTAEDIAWRGLADETGMLAAIRLAGRMALWRVDAEA